MPVSSAPGFCSCRLSQSLKSVILKPSKNCSSFRVRSGEEFTISFIHSVNRRPVYDTLRVENDHLVIVRSRYDSFGAGMPESSTGEGTLSIAKDGWLVWTVNQPIPYLTVRVGWTAEHTLHIRDRTIRLAELAEPGSAVTMRVQNINMIDFLKGRSVK